MSWLIIVFVILSALPFVLIINSAVAWPYTNETNKTIGSCINIIPPGLHFVPIRALLQPGSGGFLRHVYKKALPPDHYCLRSFLKRECSHGRPVI